jgi:hypothetical protein
MLNLKSDVRAKREAVEARLEASINIIQDLQDGRNVTAIFPHKPLCEDACCKITENEMPLYLDRHHLTPMGANYVLGKLKLKEILESEMGYAFGASHEKRFGYVRESGVDRPGG